MNGTPAIKPVTSYLTDFWVHSLASYCDRRTEFESLVEFLSITVCKW
jgi:hypothetical protein